MSSNQAIIESYYESLKEETRIRCANREYVNSGLVERRFRDIACALETALFDEKAFHFLHANRVKLTVANEESPVVEYIASQAPHPNCFESFWRVAQNESRLIIDLTRGDEMKNEDPYYPIPIYQGNEPCKEEEAVGKKVMNDMIVTHLKETQFDHDIELHQYSVFNKISEKQSLMYRIRFKNWVDREGMENVKLIGYLHALEAKVNKLFDEKLPSIVHCRAGVGRTGTYIVTAALAAIAENKGGLPASDEALGSQINELLLQGRVQRDVSFVNNLSQYITIWTFVREIKDNNWIPSNEGNGIDLAILS